MKTNQKELPQRPKQELATKIAHLAWEYTRRVALGEEPLMEGFLKQLPSPAARRQFKTIVNTHELLRAFRPHLQEVAAAVAK